MVILVMVTMVTMVTVVITNLFISVNTELRSLIPTIQNELKRFPIPSVTGQDFRLTRYICLTRLTDRFCQLGVVLTIVSTV